MAAAVIAGAAEAGADVVDIGMVGTEMLYFAVGELGLDGGIAVTASHNPKEYTGMKIVRGGALPVGGESGLLDVRDRALALRTCPEGQSLGAGRARKMSIRASSSRCSRSSTSAPSKPLRVVIDAANGMAGAMLPPVLDAAADRRRDVLLRAGRHVPEPRAEPAAAGEPRVHRPQDARGGRRSRRRVRRRRGPLLLRRRHGRVRSRRLRDGAARGGDPREGARRQGDLRRARVVGGAGDDRARRRRAAREPRRPRVHQAPDARGGRGRSPARCRRTTTSATSRRPTRASSRSCSCSS